jgi:hypothetical protein
MRGFFTRSLPEARRILLVESGSRYLLEGLIPGIRKSYGDGVQVDLVTCYAGLPEGFRPETTRVFRVQDYKGNWRGLLRELREREYPIAGIVCSAEPVMTRWKWMIAAGLPAKVFLLNENGDYFWADYGHWSSIRHFILFRAGLAGAGAVHTLGRLALFPLTLLYLLIYAGLAHARRKRTFS